MVLELGSYGWHLALLKLQQSVVAIVARLPRMLHESLCRYQPRQRHLLIYRLLTLVKIVPSPERSVQHQHFHLPQSVQVVSIFWLPSSTEYGPTRWSCIVQLSFPTVMV